METYNISLFNKNYNLKDLPNTNNILNIQSILNMKRCSGMDIDIYLLSILKKLDMYHCNLITKSGPVEVYYWIFVLEGNEFILIKEYLSCNYHLYPVAYHIKDFNKDKIKISLSFKNKNKSVILLDKLKELNTDYIYKNIDLLLDKAEEIEEKFEKNLVGFTFQSS